MTRGYKIVMYGCGAISIGVALMYLAVATLAIGDGSDSGVEIPREVNAMTMTVIVLGGMLSGGAWIVDRANRSSANRDVQPLIRAEVERTMTAFVPEISSAVAEQVNQVNARSTATTRQLVTQDLTEVVESAIGRVHRAGMVQQAQAQSGSKLRHLRMTMTSADE